jgi:hypothetical protein
MADKPKPIIIRLTPADVQKDEMRVKAARLCWTLRKSLWNPNDFLALWFRDHLTRRIFGAIILRLEVVPSALEYLRAAGTQRHRGARLPANPIRMHT